jgi:two-component system LytT family response regulator
MLKPNKLPLSKINTVGQNQKAILVDDEESARNILSTLLTRFFPELEIVAKCQDVEEAVLEINRHKPDLVFLDIEMPNYAGYEIITFFKEINFEIIFVTAYDQYAIKAFEISAVDYLLKPIEIDRLKESVERFKDKKATKCAAANYDVLTESLSDNSIQKLVLPYKDTQKVVMLEDIVALEANDSYCNVHCVNGQNYMVSKNLKHFEGLLDEKPNFVRTHKSWMVNINHAYQYSNSSQNVELSSGIAAKVSRYKKADFEAALKL